MMNEDGTPSKQLDPLALSIAQELGSNATTVEEAKEDPLIIRYIEDKLARANEESKVQNYVFCDPVHGHIVLDPILVKIIDTPQFQRLRNIKQLGGKYFVYPGASHNRFEHSLGVAHLAGKLVEKIRAKQGSSLGITDRDVLCVKIAGLCHDLGHGPFSHVWDGSALPGMKEKYPELNLKKWKHEQGSVMMLDHLIEKNGIREELKKLEEYKSKANLIDANTGEKIDADTAIDQDIRFIKELIDGPQDDKPVPGSQPTLEDDEWRYEGRPEEKSFLFEIVANKRNGIDVDRWDYFKRDCHYLGITCIFDINRAMEFVRVLKPKDEKTQKEERLQICYRDKEKRNLYQMFQTRELLHRIAYQHKTARAVQHMLTKALVLSGRTLKIPVINDEGVVEEKIEMSQCHRHPAAYTNLTDHVFQLILTSAEPAEARKLLIRIQKRDVYTFLGEVPAPSPKCTADVIAGFSEDPKLKDEDFLIDKVTFDFGMKDKDPFDFIQFFSKKDHNKAKKIPLHEISTLLPKKFQEEMIRVYCICSSKVDEDKVKEAKRCFERWEECYRKSKEETPLSSPSKPDGSEEGHESSSRSSEAQRTLDFDSAKPIVTA